MPIRLLVAFAGGCAVTLALSLIAAYLIHVVDERRKADEIEAHPVDLLLGYDQLDLKELLGEPRHQLPDIARAPELPEFRPPTRQISGFVMLEVEVDAEGRPVSARVLDAEPADVFEAAAIQEAMSERWPVGVAGTRDHVVRFSVPSESETGSPPDD